NKQYEEYARANDAKDEKLKEKIRQELDEITKSQLASYRIVYHKYLKESASSPIALYVLGRYAGYDIDPKTIELLFNSLSESAQRSQAGVAFKSQIEIAKRTAV